MTDLPLGILLAPKVFPQGSVRPPICEWHNEILYQFGIGGSLLAGLEVSLSSLLFTVGLVFLLTGCTSVEVFWFVVLRLGVSSIVSTHSTDVISLLCFPGDWHGQGQRVLARGISRWTVVGGLVSS